MSYGGEVYDIISNSKRKCYIPIVKEVKYSDDNNVFISKFGGKPYIPEYDSYPVCKHCQQHMNLMI